MKYAQIKSWDAICHTQTHKIFPKTSSICAVRESIAHEFDDRIYGKYRRGRAIRASEAIEDGNRSTRARLYMHGMCVCV